GAGGPARPGPAPGRTGPPTPGGRSGRPGGGGAVLPGVPAAAAIRARGVGTAGEHGPVHGPPLVAAVQLAAALADHADAGVPGVVAAELAAVGGDARRR